MSIGEGAAFRVVSRLRRLFPYKCRIRLFQGIGNREQRDWAVAQFGEVAASVALIFSHGPDDTWALWLAGECAISGHDWAYFADEFYFNDENDAILFKLRWG